MMHPCSSVLLSVRPSSVGILGMDIDAHVELGKFQRSKFIFPKLIEFQLQWLVREKARHKQSSLTKTLLLCSSSFLESAAEALAFLECFSGLRGSLMTYPALIILRVACWDFVKSVLSFIHSADVPLSYDASWSDRKDEHKGQSEGKLFKKNIHPTIMLN